MSISREERIEIGLGFVKESREYLELLITIFEDASKEDNRVADDRSSSEEERDLALFNVQQARARFNHLPMPHLIAALLYLYDQQEKK